MKYDGTNFPSYKRTMTDIMVMCKLTKYFNGAVEKPTDIESTEYEDWLSNITTVIHIMRLNCDDERKSMVEECTSANDIFVVLQESYLSVSTCNRMRLERKFNRFEMDTSKPFQESINELNKLARELKEVGSEKKSSDKLDALLAGLDSSLKDYLPVWKVDKTLTYSDLCAQIINIEQDLDKSKPLSDMKQSVALVNQEKHASKESYRRRPKQKGPLKCYRCEKLGHKAKDCRTPLGQSCLFCNKKGHASDKCWYKDRPKAPGSSLVAKALVAGSFELIQMHDNDWILDSGASNHMTGQASLLSKCQAVAAIDIHTASGKTIHSSTVGSVSVGNHVISDVLSVPGLQFNLLSVHQLTKKGVTVEFLNDIAVLKLDGEVIFQAVKGADGLYRIVNTSVSHYSLVSASVWHDRLGHISHGKLKKMMSLIGDSSNIPLEKVDSCDICTQAKQKRSSFGTFGGLRSTRPLELVHTDLLEVNIRSLGGKRYILTFIDDFTRYAKLRYLAKKSDVLEELKQCIAEAERETSLSVSRIRSDNGGEYQRLEHELKAIGIKWETTTSYTPEMNGVAERYNGKLLEMSRALLLGSNLPKTLWAELINTSNYLMNRTYHSTIDSIPYCKYFNKQSISVDFYRTIGCKAYVLTNEVSNKHFRGTKRKLDPRSKCMTLVGYDISEKVYRLFDSETNQVVRSRDVKFVEQEQGPNKSQAEKVSDIELEITQVSFTEGYEYPTMNEETMKSNIEDRISADKHMHSAKEARHEKDAHESNKEITSFDIEVPPKPEGEFELIHALVSKAENESCDEPRTIQEAKSSTHWPEWRQAMESEYNSLISNNTWEYSELPTDRKLVKGKWIFKVKKDQFGRIARYKCRYVAKGFSQVQGLDYQETFSPTVKYVTLRILLALSTQYDWNVDQIDYETAFLNGELQEDIYMEEPEGFESSPRKVLKLKKSLYGLKQAPREWNIKLDNMLKSIGFKQCQVDSGLYYADIEMGNKMYITVFVDDLVCFYPRDSDSARKLKDEVKHGFKSKDLGECSHILGMHVTRNRESGTISISQKQYILNLLKQFQLEDCKSVETPLNPGTIYTATGMKNLPESEPFEDVTLYQKAIGSCIYLMISSRPDISFAVSHLARFMTKPRQVHWLAIRRVFRYLKGTLDRKLTYQKDGVAEPVGYADASFAPDLTDCRSVMGYLFKLSGAAVIWKTQRQHSVARSTCDAEFMALGHCAAEAAWLRNLLIEIGMIDKSKSIMIYGDNQSSIKVSKHPVFHQRMKHIAIQYHYTRELVNSKVIDIAFVSSKEMTADILTKGLGLEAHSNCVQGLGITNK